MKLARLSSVYEINDGKQFFKIKLNSPFQFKPMLLPHAWALHA